LVFIGSDKENIMTNDIKTIENKFVTAMGSGIAASGHLRDLVASVVTSQDGRPLASAIARLISKGDKQGANAVRAIIGAIMPGAKVGKAKDKKTIVLSLKDAKFDDAAMQRLSDGVDRKLSLRSTLVKEVKGETAKAEFVLPEYAAKLVKRLEKEGVNKAALIAAIQAA
jgi:hypothetical protein